MKINPQLTQDFIADMEEKRQQGSYHIELIIKNQNIALDIFAGVFPPQSDFSTSSRSVYERFGDLTGKLVADIGCGSGIESIAAALAGAEHVDATDINDAAVTCTRHNVIQNNLNNKISIYKGDLFSGLPNKKYDLIIANLPIVNFKPTQESDITATLYDPDFILHKRLFTEAKMYLSENGTLTFTHANLQSGKTDTPNQDFNNLETLISVYGYNIAEKSESQALGYTWINYRLRLSFSPEMVK